LKADGSSSLGRSRNDKSAPAHEKVKPSRRENKEGIILGLLSKGGVLAGADQVG
jgi:hypothetical protein